MNKSVDPRWSSGSRICLALTLVTLLTFAGLGHALGEDDDEAPSTIIIKLKKGFIEKYKSRVTINSKMILDAVGKIHSAKDDGDAHMAGRDPEIGLPIVAEIKNARDELDTIINARSAAKAKEAVKIQGAWRLWYEHGGSGQQIQGKELKPFTTSNPPHVFEIHPVTEFNGTNLRRSIRAIDGYRYKDATRAFLHYENVRCRIVPK